MKMISTAVLTRILIGVILVAAPSILPSAYASPLPLSQPEQDWPYVLYAGDAFRACQSVNNARLAGGLPELIENPVLADAGRRLLERMLKEDWVGTELPSGYNLTRALAEAGYPSGYEVRAVFRVSKITEWRGYFGDSSGLGTNAAAKACSSMDGFNPNLTAFGYFTIEPKSDVGRVDTNTQDNGGGYYEVMLFGSLPPPVGERPLIDVFKLRNKYNLKLATPAASIVAKRGFLLNRSVVGTPASKYISGRARIKGRLPKGVRFNGALARFYGTPKKKGNFRVQVIAKYRKRKDFTSDGTDGGVKTISVILRVR